MQFISTEVPEGTPEIPALSEAFEQDEQQMNMMIEVDAMKNDPKTIAKEGVKQSRVEILVLFVLTTVGAVVFFQMHWIWAVLLAPFLIVAMLVGVMVFVQVLWMTVLGLDRIGQACGLRKSPLA